MINKLIVVLVFVVVPATLFAGEARIKPALEECKQVVWTSESCPPILKSGNPNMDLLVDVLFDQGKIIKIKSTERIYKTIFTDIKKGVFVKGQSGWRFIRIKMKYELNMPLIRVMLCPCEGEVPNQ